MDLSKYLKNKDIKIKDSDIDLDALTNDLRDGYISSKELESKIKDANKTATSELTTKYADLESKYNTLEKQNGDLVNKNATLSLEKTMIGKGFKESDFTEVSKLRSTLYADEKDDAKAIDQIANRFKNTYFGDGKPSTPPVPNEPGFSGQGNGASKDEIKITRNTKLRDLIIAKK